VKVRGGPVNLRDCCGDEALKPRNVRLTSVGLRSDHDDVAELSDHNDVVEREPT
jgi:hypothetical protein